ncbi:porin family protein [Rhodobacteraceae bacterium RKSG542]|uniref:outer membrane protein n=1 Tax=Pseudovibrio flavus TaxID=2529854 RepID=UPI0012BD0EFE|nr:outer membrane beta-barrel protein [Pseudovibrio flavus]MTI16213.1 porin family protein [Pseudovibrio flavus]
MFSRICLFLAASVLVQLPTAYADELSPDFDWGGFYAGVKANALILEDDYIDPVADLDGFITDYKIAPTVVVGYLWQRNQFVYGAEFGVSWVGSDKTEQDVSDPYLYGTMKVNSSAHILGRVGVTSDRTLLYLQGGATLTSFDFDYPYDTGLPQGDGFSETLIGATLGLGVEHALNENWRISADFTHTTYPVATSTIINCCASPPNSQDHQVTTSSFNLGLAYQF